MKTLTVFTPTYNRVHTLPRLYESLCRQTLNVFDWLVIDDGSSDGTREWIDNLGEKVIREGKRFDWMGRESDGVDENHFVIETDKFCIEYIYKPNGGLYTGYNTAYATITTELCVCIDSDDYMPEDAVAKIVDRWRGRPGDKEYCGVLGLDFNVVDGEPIGGFFPIHINEAFQLDLAHVGDTKQVMKTALMKEVAPQVGFEGEKDFNPFYMLSQVLDIFPVLVLNENLCWVEYQTGADSMSEGIWKQYYRSPQSFAKYRINQMTLTHGNSWKKRFRVCAHYVSSCILSRDREWLKTTPLKGTTLLAAPLGLVLTLLVKWKNRQ